MNSDYQCNSGYAKSCDEKDPLRRFRNRFLFPKTKEGKDFIYLCGNSLGLQPDLTREYVTIELDEWARLGVEGHVTGKNPWMPYHEYLTDTMAEVVGARPQEIVVMNSLTVNLHLLMVSFYRPTKGRYKIVIEQNAFPSDIYAVKSQLRFHGFNENEGLIVLKNREGEEYLRTEDILSTLKAEGSLIALVLLSGVNYYSGQAFDIATITGAGHEIGAVVGWDLAHAAGNIDLRLHEHNVDFAAWCSYKYMNSGPGSLSGIFVHERHADRSDLPRFAGWWGHDKESRFAMPDDFVPIKGAEGWQLSNPPILSMAAIRASMELFREAGIQNLREKSIQLTGYLEYLLQQRKNDKIQILTPSDPGSRGAQLSLRIPTGDKSIVAKFAEKGVITDWREPDVMRVAPAPLYNSFEDVYRFVEILDEILE